MKTKVLSAIVVMVMVLTYSCTDKWDAHYLPQEKVINSSVVEVVELSAQEYIQSNSDLSSIATLLDQQQIFEQLSAKDQQFTVLVYANSSMSSATIEDPEFFAQTCVSNLAFTPTKLVDGLQVQMWNGKYLEVGVDATTGTNVYTIAGSRISKIIQVSDGYVYIMESLIYAPKSLYEVLVDLGDNYSLFKELVLRYEEQVFDKSASTPVGVDNTGNTVYDSVFVTKNLLMDRYYSGGSEKWNMRSEFYASTLLIPNNTLVSTALTDAYQAVRDALSREPNANDTLKFEQYIVKSAFYDKVLTALDLDGEVDLYSVDGYIEGESASTSGVQWKPTVQRVDTSRPVTLSNGVAYYTTALKIPNNVVIWRIKNRFYIWDNCTVEQKAEYFKWNGIDNISIHDAGGFGPIGPWPWIPYKLIRAYPDANAKAAGSEVSVEITGIALQADGTVGVVMVPPGEYDLRMGFESSAYPYAVDIYFNEALVKENLNPNIHYDRTGSGYPEGYVPAEWYSTNNKSANYDRDGGQIATVTVPGPGLQPIKIKIASKNIATLGAAGNSKARYELYHWCLRPTANNY